MKYYLGIDGGGTRTTAAVSDESGKIILKSVGKTINFYSVGIDASRRNLEEIINDIKSKIGDVFFDAAFVGCSALDSEADEQTLNALCGGIINAGKIRMDSDVYIALKSVDTDESHCVAICGTGSMAVGEDENGKITVKGGWGHIIGDEGSAYSIAVNALKKCCEFHDSGITNGLLKAANGYFNTNDFRKAIDVIYSPDTSKDIIAGFASEVARLAQKGEKEAAEIICCEAKGFSKTVLSLLKELGNCRLLSLYGGVFQHNELFRNEFSDEIKKEYPEIRIELLNVAPEEGALGIARKMQ